MEVAESEKIVHQDNVGQLAGTGLTGYASKNYLKFFWLLILVLLGYTFATFSTRSMDLTLAGWLSIIIAGIPIALWVVGVVPGLPVYPLFAFCYLVSFAVQFLLNSGRKLDGLAASEIWGAAFTFCLFIACGTVGWAAVLKFRRSAPRMVRAFEPGRGDALLIVSLGVSDIFYICNNAYWLPLPASLVSIVRAFITGLSALAIFVIAYRIGAGQISSKTKKVFIILFTIYVVASTATLFLIGAISALLMTSIGYALGKNAVPWKLLAFMLITSSILHLGKGEMRAKYWSEGGQSYQITPFQYPEIFAEWFSISLSAIASQKADAAQSTSIYERSSLLDLLIMARDVSPSKMPFLNGETYRLLPGVFIPRIMNDEKISTHEADTILNVYYEKQSRESTVATTFGWGLLNESYANYGLNGVACVGLIVGVLYGLMTRISLFQPLLSLPTLISLTGISYAIQTESSSTYLTAALFQSVVAVIITGFVFMKKVPADLAMEWQNS